MYVTVESPCMYIQPLNHSLHTFFTYVCTYHTYISTIPFSPHTLSYQFSLLSTIFTTLWRKKWQMTKKKMTKKKMTAFWKEYFFCQNDTLIPSQNCPYFLHFFRRKTLLKKTKKKHNGFKFSHLRKNLSN
jgi:hypothetical protein